MNEFKLNKKPKLSSGFLTPEGYFDAVSGIIFEKATRETRSISVFRISTKWKIATAAILVIGLLSLIHI